MSRTLSARRRLLAVFGGGFLGTLARYLLSGWIQAGLGKGWPYDILFINISGALLLAFITSLAEATFLIGPTRRLFINVGFLGAYTTFSSLSLGTVLLLRNGHIFPALLYLFLSLVGAVLAVTLGDALGQQFVTAMRRSAPKPGKTHQLTGTFRAEGDRKGPHSSSAPPPLTGTFRAEGDRKGPHSSSAPPPPLQ